MFLSRLYRRSNPWVQSLRVRRSRQSGSPPRHPVFEQLEQRCLLSGPTANDDSYDAVEDTTLDVPARGVLANDTGSSTTATLTAVLTAGPTNGQLSLDPNGSFVYVPNANFNGLDQFSYRATEGSAISNVAVVTIRIAGVNDPPTFDPISDRIILEDAGPQHVAITQVTPGPLDESGQQVAFRTFSSDAAIISSLTIASTPSPFGPLWTLSFETADNANGVAMVAVTADDGQSVDSSFSRVFAITIQPVNDVPVAAADFFDVPANDGLTGDVLFNDSDADGDPLTANVVAEVSHGSLYFFSDGSFRYYPDDNFVGLDSFTYRANDGAVDSNIATVTITVQQENTAPIAEDDAFDVAEDGNLIGTVTFNDSDAEGDGITAHAVTGVSHGALSFFIDGSFQYVPDPGFTGTDSFTYVDNDGISDSNIATVIITVNPPPIFQSCLAQRQSLDHVFVHGQLDGVPVGSGVTSPAESLNVGIVGLSATHELLENTWAGVPVDRDGSFMGYLDAGIASVPSQIGDADAVVCLFAGTVALPVAHSEIEPIIEPPDARSLRQLRADSLTPLEVRFNHGIPRFVSAHVAIASNLPALPAVQSLAFLNRYHDFYGLSDVRSELFLQRITTDSTGAQHIFFGERQNNIPVFGAQIAVHINGGFVMATTGNYLPDSSILGLPAVQTPIDGAAAEAIALADAGGGSQVTGPAKLMYLDQSLLGAEPTEIRLTWRVGLRGWYTFVDASTGDVLRRIATVDDDKDFDIETGEGGSSVSCWSFGGSTQWFDEDGPTDDYKQNFPAGEPDGDKGFDFTHFAYDAYAGRFQLDSYDNDGEDVEVYLHVAIANGPNAHYDEGCDIFEFSSNFITRDVFVHEYTHAVTHAFPGLIYNTESGALNESYSDVFAEFFESLVKTPDWLLGEDLPGGAVRNMADPPANGQPDRYSNLCSSDKQCKFSTDNGGVHTNSGIPNKVAFLIANGGVHNGYQMQGIGIDKTEQLYFDVLTSWLGPSSQLEDAANATISQAVIYQQLQLHNFTLTDVCTVKNAWASVEIRTDLADSDCDGIPDNQDSDRDGDARADFADNCVNIANPNQKDTDGDLKGDACDPDKDGDGILDDGDHDGKEDDHPCIGGNKVNCDDNAPINSNPNQEDHDNDGIGDVIDDGDHDGVPDIHDNCQTKSNSDQIDTDGDGKGDECDLDKDNDGVPDDGDFDLIPGDHPCTGGSILNCDDNAPLTPNSDQKDDDADGVGDVIDNCSKFNPDQSDLDGDGIGDLCDTDIDGDGVDNRVDFCPEIYDPDNSFFDCHSLTIKDSYFFPANAPLRIPIDLGDPPMDFVPDQFVTQVSVRLPFEMPARIVDDEGFVVAKAKFGASKSISFHPSMDFSYRAPSAEVLNGSVQNAFTRSLMRSSQDQPYHGHHYFLEIFPTAQVVSGKPYQIGLQVVSKVSSIDVDITPPIFASLPAEISVQATSPAGAVVQYPLPVIVDVGDPAPLLACSPAADSLFAIGETVVTCTATDHSGNSSSASFMVTVRPDTTGAIVRSFQIEPLVARKPILDLLLSFSEPLEPTSATDLNSYSLVTAGKDKRFGTPDDQPVAIGSATYLTTSMQVRLTPKKSLPANRTFQITVKGKGPLTDLSGNHLDGNGDGVNNDDWAKSFSRATTLSAVVVDSVLGHTLKAVRSAAAQRHRVVFT